MPDQILIVINGFPEAAPPDLTITDLIIKYAAQQQKLGVEVDGILLHPSDYGTTVLRDGSTVELICFAFGGMFPN